MLDNETKYTRKKVNSHTANKMDSGFVERWLDHAHGGGSVPQFCRNERICRQTFYNRCQKYPHILDARALGKLWAEGWWLEQAQQHLVTYSSKDEGSTKFDTALYKWITAGRFGHSEDKEQKEMLEELMRRTAHLANAPTSAIAEEAECEPDDNTSE